MKPTQKFQTGFGHIVVLLAVVVVSVVGYAGYYEVSSHNKVANLHEKSEKNKSASELNTKTPGTVSDESKIQQQSDTKSTTATKTTPPPTSKPSVNPSPVSVPTPAPAVSRFSGAISFSADGCKVTATGTPGLLLAGLVQRANRHKGGPLISPDGMKITASGTVTANTVVSNFDFSTYVIDATLTDPNGATVATGTTSITSHNCQ
jgi:hypothetical protein